MKSLKMLNELIEDVENLSVRFILHPYQKAFIDFTMLGSEKTQSKQYWVDYGNVTFEDYFASLEQGRNHDSDLVALNFISYLIGHYEIFESTCSTEEKQKLLFAICRTVNYLTNNVSGGNINGLVDKYTLKPSKDSYGFEDNNIFRDLKYLQKVTAYNRTESSPSYYGNITEEEMKGFFTDIVHTLKPIVDLELYNPRSFEEKDDVRQRYLAIEQYPNIFAVAASYREQQRLEDATSALTVAIGNLGDPSKDFVLHVVLRAIAILGESITQKNLTLQTRLNNSEFILSLQQIKDIANDIVKPNSYNFTAAVIKNIDFTELGEQLRFLYNGLVNLRKLHDNATYTEKLAYYSKAAKIAKPYLSPELIDKLRGFINNEFPSINEDQQNELGKLLSSEKANAKFITEILAICKASKDQKKSIFSQYKQLIEDVKAHIPDQKQSANIENIDQIRNLVKLVQGQNDPSTSQFKKVQFALRKFFESKLEALPEPLLDDNLIELEFKKLQVNCGPERDALIMGIYDQERKFCFPSSLNIEAHIKHIKAYSDSGLTINFPRKFFGLDGTFISKIKMSDQLVFNFLNYIENHKQETIDHIINYSKYCQLCSIIKAPNNKQATEFLLQTAHELMKNKNDQASYYPKEEYRILRNGIRHFEDNLDVLETPTPIEMIYAHYAIRFLGENIDV